MKARIVLLSTAAVLAILLLSPGRALACACCSNEGDYRIGFSKPDEYTLGQLKRMRFGLTANLFQTEGGDDEGAAGFALHSEKYALNGSLDGNVWRLVFRDGDKSGTLNLPLPSKVLSFAADIHDGQTSGGGGPLLYKEWRFEGEANGTGIFQAGIVPPTKYFLVLQGRGNACNNAEDFKHWRLEITGKKANFAFYGELGEPKGQN